MEKKRKATVFIWRHTGKKKGNLPFSCSARGEKEKREKKPAHYEGEEKKKEKVLASFLSSLVLTELRLFQPRKKGRERRCFFPKLGGRRRRGTKKKKVLSFLPS